MFVGMEFFKKDQFEGVVSFVYVVMVINDLGKYICLLVVFEFGSEFVQDDELVDRLMEFMCKVVMEKIKSDFMQQGCLMDDFVLY